MTDQFTRLAGYSPDDASDVGIRMKVLAGEVYSLGCAIDWLKHQTFAQTATGEELEKRAMERGLARKPATPASGTLTFGRKTALWYAVPIPAGTVCATSGAGAVRYVTTQDAELPTAAMSVDVPAKAETPGAGGNADAGTVTAMVTAPASLEFVTNTPPFTGGVDAESDDSLRRRLMDCWGEPANGTNAAWYRQFATGFDGVSSAGVVPCANGVGTVAVYLGGTGGTPADSVVQQVRAAFQEKREINVGVTVQAAQTVPVDVTCTAKAGPGQNAVGVKMQVRAAIMLYFRSLGVGEPVVLSALTSKIFETGLVDDCTFSTEGKTMAANQLAVAGNVIVEVE